MRKKQAPLNLVLSVVLLFVVAFGIFPQVSQLWASSTTARSLQSAPVHITITDQGFVPAVVTATVGTQITWSNQTSQPVEIVGGSIFDVYLPLVIGSASSPGQRFLPQINATHKLSVEGESSWTSGIILSGESYTRTFTTIGEHSYRLKSDLTVRGLVIVQEGASPTPTATNTATTTSTPSPTATGTSNPTNTPTATYTSTSTATSTSTPTATPTSTPIVNFPDLILNKSDQNITAAPGATITYTLSYSNVGSEIASGVVITETLPEFTEFNSEASSPGWNQVDGGNLYTFGVGSLPVSSTGIVTFSVTVDNVLPEGVDNIRNTASISDDGSYGPDPSPENNTSVTNTVVYQGPTEVCGVISNDSTWTPAHSPYISTCSITINSGVTLTLTAGTVFKLQGTTHNITVNGRLQAQGTQADPVTITSIKDDSVGGDTNNDGDATLPAPRDWGAIVVGSSGITSLDYTLVQYGGSYQYSNSGIYMSVYVTGNGQLILNHSTISHSSGNGIYLRNSLDQTARLEIYHSVIENNGASGVLLANNDGSSRTNEVIVSDSIFRNNGAIGLSVSYLHSAVVTNSTFSNNTSHGFSAGYLSTTSNNLVLLSNHFDENGAAGMRVSVGGQVNISNNIATGNTNNGLEIIASGILTPTVTGNQSIDNSGYPFVFTGNQEIYFSENTFYENSATGNSINGVFITGRIAGTLIPQVNQPYVTSATGYRQFVSSTSGGWINEYPDIVVLSQSTLVIRPGVVFKFTPRTSNYAGVVLIRGSLSIEGTAEEPVVFTSLNDDQYLGDTNGDGNASAVTPGDWGGIRLISGAQATVNHFVGLYGGHYLYTYSWISGIGVGYGLAALIEADDADLNITNSVIAYSETSGINALAASSVEAHQNKITSNETNGISASTTSTVNAVNNWWGTDSGPAPYGAGNGISYTNSCSDGVCTVIPRVVVAPWIGYQAFHGRNVPNAAYSSDPVNTANGNFVYERADLDIATRGIPLSFTRSYNSLSTADSPMGVGWRHSWLVEVELFGEDARVTFGGGRQVRFTWNGSGYTPAPGVYATLTYENGHFQFIDKDQTVYTFDPSNHLESITDRNGNVTNLIYTGELLAVIAAPDGRQLVLTYDGANRIVEVSDPAGRIIQYAYDDSGNLVSDIDPSGATTTYLYDDNHRLLTVTDANGHAFVNNIYNGEGRVVEQRDAQGNLTTFSYDIVNKLTTVTNPLGNTTAYQYDNELRLISETDALGNRVVYTYDANSNRSSATDKQNNITFYAYDDWGNILLITDTLGYTRTFTYDNLNNLLAETDAEGNTTRFVYDVHSNVVQQIDALGNTTRFDYDIFGQVISSTNALGQATTYTYDIYGNQTSATNALGYVSAFEYDNIGRVLTETDALGRSVTYTYDDLNRVLSVNEPLGRVTTYGYDAVGNRTSIVDPRGGMTSFVYDDKDRLVNVLDALNNPITYTYDAVNNLTTLVDPLGNITGYSYDELDRLTTIVDPLGYSTTYTYDSNGNRTSTTDTNRNNTVYTYDQRDQLVAVTDAAGGTVTYSYDGNGNRISMTDANDHTTTYTYDALKRLISSSNPISSTNSFTYDALGNRLSFTKPDGVTISYTYDALNRLITTSYPGGVTSYAFDSVGNRTIMTDTLGVTTYAYDELGRIVQVTDPTGSLSYGYDLGDNRTSLIYPNGEVVTYNYDLNNRLINVTDWDGRATTYTYDAAGRQTSVQYPNNVEASYSYDPAGRLLGLVHAHPSYGTIAFSTYTLDAVGNRMSMEDLDGLTSYDYDALYRLTGVTYPDGEVVSYTYDPMGNRMVITSTVAGVTTYSYDEADRLLSFTNTGTTTTLTWDANGNMVGKGGDVYIFDPLDRLTGFSNGTVNVEFAYNGDGVRLNKTLNGVTTSYLQDLTTPLPVVLNETSNGQSSNYVYGRELLMMEDAVGVLSFYHADGLGSTRALSASDGQQTDEYAYDAFGIVRNHVGSGQQPFKFAGEQEDSETDLLFLRARYYDPLNARFISADTYPESSGRSETINRYVYTGQNPINRVDPSGHFFCTVIPGLGEVCDTIGKGPNAPAAQLPEIMGFKFTFAENAGLLSGPQAYVLGVAEGMASGDLFSFDEDIAAARGIWNLLRLYSSPFSNAIRDSQIFPNLLENLKKSISFNLVQQAYASEGYYDRAATNPTMGTPPSGGK